jgi:hypothetical protein
MRLVLAQPSELLFVIPARAPRHRRVGGVPADG